MLVYFEPAALCNLQPDLKIAPLPSEKALWEARDEFAWRDAKGGKERAFSNPPQTAFALASSGDLVLVDEGQIHCSDAVRLRESSSRTRARPAASWEEWCSGMDALGGLVMLAASLIV